MGSRVRAGRHNTSEQARRRRDEQLDTARDDDTARSPVHPGLDGSRSSIRRIPSSGDEAADGEGGRRARTRATDCESGRASRKADRQDSTRGAKDGAMTHRLSTSTTCAARGSTRIVIGAVGAAPPVVASLNGAPVSTSKQAVSMVDIKRRRGPSFVTPNVCAPKTPPVACRDVRRPRRNERRQRQEPDNTSHNRTRVHVLNLATPHSPNAACNPTRVLCAPRTTFIATAASLGGLRFLVWGSVVTRALRSGSLRSHIASKLTPLCESAAAAAFPSAPPLSPMTIPTGPGEKEREVIEAKPGITSVRRGEVIGSRARVWRASETQT